MLSTLRAMSARSLATPLAAPLAALARQGVYLGTSSWKYDGWLGQLYEPERYLYRQKFSKTRFERACLEEYAEVFPSVCVDASYYRFPGEKFLSTIHEQVPAGFLFTHKVTDTVTIKHFPRLARHGEFAGRDNPHFLNSGIFLSSFLKPLERYREQTGLLIFEFSRFYSGDFERGRDFVDQLDRFLGALPTDEWDFGVEVRNASLLEPAYFEVLANNRVAHVYNQWQRMPTLGEQLALHPPDPSRAPTGARLLLKAGRPYQEAVDTFSPYQSIQEPQPEVRSAAAKLIGTLRNQAGGRKSYLYVNNRLEGNALGTIAAILDILAAM